jgi:peptidyl-tRNA hydrolase
MRRGKETAQGAHAASAWLAEVHLITDRGLTELGGVPTRTCLAVGPDYDDLIHPVTGDLDLY